MSFLFEQISKLKKAYFLILIIVLLIVINDAIILSDVYYINKNRIDITNKSLGTEVSVPKESTVNKYVDIKGAVKKPGVYKIDDNMIVNDVIKLAGLAKNATTDNINLSQKVKDQMVIVISNKNDLKNNIRKNNVVISGDTLINNQNQNNVEASNINGESNKLININTSSVDDLMLIPGIGKTKADAIIEYRENNQFNSIEDIKNVTGIGESLFEKIRLYITI
jgi:competence protein ComEA